MAKKGNWSISDEQTLRDRLKSGYSLAEIADILGKTEEAVYLYCYRHNIPTSKQLENPIMVKLLAIKFGDPKYFHPTKEFYRSVGISQKRWAHLAWGYAQPTQDELRRVAKSFNFSLDEAFALMEARQLNLFNQ